MPQANQPGVADQQVETQGEDRHDHDLGAELYIESRAKHGKQGEQQHGGDQ